MARRSDSARRIAILTASFGGPQRAVADALHRYFRTAHSFDVRSEVVEFLDAFTPKAAVLAGLAYQREEPFFPAGFGDSASLAKRWGELPVVLEFAASGQAAFDDYLDRARPEAVISTFPFAAAMAAGSAKRVRTAQVMSGFSLQGAWIHPAVDLFFVPTREVLEDLVVMRVPYDRITVTGVPVHERYAEAVDKASCRKELGLSDRFTALLLGGASGGDLRGIAAGLLRSGVRVVAAVPRDDRARRHLEPLAGESDALKLVDGSAMHKLMAAADVIVAGAGGSAVREAVNVGVPSVIYTPVPGQELRNVDFLVNAGCVLLGRDDADVIEKVRYLSSHTDRLAQLGQAASALRRRDAAQAVCERVLAGL